MSSTQSNSNTNQNRNAAYDDYGEDTTFSAFLNTNVEDPLSIDNTIEPIPDEYDEDDDDDDFSSDVEAQLHLNPDENEEELYSDEVQNAYANYENEFSQYWTQTESTWIGSTTDEQDETYKQMRECMQFMSQEYMMAEMPSSLVERVQESQLNPDAVDFCPSWLSASTSTDNTPIVVTSWAPCEAKKQDD